jgi:hypothetical protein
LKKIVDLNKILFFWMVNLQRLKLILVIQSNDLLVWKEFILDVQVTYVSIYFSVEETIEDVELRGLEAVTENKAFVLYISEVLLPIGSVDSCIEDAQGASD